MVAWRVSCDRSSVRRQTHFSSHAKKIKGTSKLKLLSRKRKALLKEPKHATQL
jgi:hypothetical protein